MPAADTARPIVRLTLCGRRLYDSAFPFPRPGPLMHHQDGSRCRTGGGSGQGGADQPAECPIDPDGARARHARRDATQARLSVLTKNTGAPRASSSRSGSMDSPPADLRARILSHMNAWVRGATCALSRPRPTPRCVLLAPRATATYILPGHRDVLLIPANARTMNLDGFTMNTPDPEFTAWCATRPGPYGRIFRMSICAKIIDRIDKQKAFSLHFMQTQGLERAGDPAGADGCWRTGPDRHLRPGRPDLHHVLLAAGQHHEGRPGRQRRQRHQRA